MSGVPRVSVVVPAYNADATLGDCLRAFVSQSRPGEQFEVVVVDEGLRALLAAVQKEPGLPLPLGAVARAQARYHE